MSTATSFLRLSVPYFSFKSKSLISRRTIDYNKPKLSSPPWRRPLAETSFDTQRKVHSVSQQPVSSPEPSDILKTLEPDHFNTPLEFTTGDPPPIGRLTNDSGGPDFPKPPLRPPPTGPEVVPVPPSPPYRKPPPPEVDPPSPPDLVPPPLTPPEYVPPDIPTPVPPDIPPPKGPTFVF